MEAVDAFTQNWGGQNNWILPPVSQSSGGIVYAWTCKAVGTLVFSMGKWLYFWLLLREDGKHRDSFVRENLFIKGKAKNHIFGCKDLSFSVVSLRLNFKQPRRQLFSAFWTADGDSCSLCNNCWGVWNLLRPEKSFWHLGLLTLCLWVSSLCLITVVIGSLSFIERLVCSFVCLFVCFFFCLLLSPAHCVYVLEKLCVICNV